MIGFVKRHKRLLLWCVVVYAVAMIVLLILSGGPQQGAFRYQIF
jgi:hypothetical protein